MQTIHLKTPSAEGNIYIGAGAKDELARLAVGAKFVVTDGNVYALYRKFLLRYFDEGEIFVLPAGEAHKNFTSLGEILSRITECGLTRTSTLFAIGGGVVGDIGGLAAALYMRGINCVQVPTTLLSQVDSSVGGKTAVDHQGVKNIVGAFYQPKTVLVDPWFLDTLPAREIKCGLGEIVKYAALDGAFYDKLTAAEKLSDLAFLTSLVYPSLVYKARVVEADEKESGERRCLNVGHTTAHAIELKYGLSHGESVLYGLLFETALAKKYGVCEQNHADGLIALVKRALEVEPTEKIDFSEIRQAAANAKSDKKNGADGKITMAVAKSKGRWAEFSLPYADYENELAAFFNGEEK